MKFDCSEPTAKASKGKRLKERMNRKYRNECKMNAKWIDWIDVLDDNGQTSTQHDAQQEFAWRHLKTIRPHGSPQPSKMVDCFERVKHQGLTETRRHISWKVPFSESLWFYSWFTQHHATDISYLYIYNIYIYQHTLVIFSYILGFSY